MVRKERNQCHTEARRHRARCRLRTTKDAIREGSEPRKRESAGRPAVERLARSGDRARTGKEGRSRKRGRAKARRGGTFASWRRQLVFKSCFVTADAAKTLGTNR